MGHELVELIIHEFRRMEPVLSVEQRRFTEVANDNVWIGRLPDRSGIGRAASEQLSTVSLTNRDSRIASHVLLHDCEHRLLEKSLDVQPRGHWTVSVIALADGQSRYTADEQLRETNQGRLFLGPRVEISSDRPKVGCGFTGDARQR